MELDGFIRKIKDIMKSDSGVNGDAQCVAQTAWLLFLWACGSPSERPDAGVKGIASAVPRKFRWDAWAACRRDGKTMTGDTLLDFVDNRLFPALRDLKTPGGALSANGVVKAAFMSARNYMKDGVLLRQVIDLIGGLDLSFRGVYHPMGSIYEGFLHGLGQSSSLGEFYTPRPVTDFMARMTAPRLGERVADFACGTGGFLSSALNELDGQLKSAEDGRIRERSVFGVEKSPVPHMLCLANLLAHGISKPDVVLGDSLDGRIPGCRGDERFGVILMNPPYGGVRRPAAKADVTGERLHAGDALDGFLGLVMSRLSRCGRAAVLVPDGFMSGTGAVRTAVRQAIVQKFDLHTVVRLPVSVFAPHTRIATNILFFDGQRTVRTATWFYRLDPPDGNGRFSRTRPMTPEHLVPIEEWWRSRKELSPGGVPKARRYTGRELAARNFDLNLCGYDRASEIVASPEETIRQFRDERACLLAKMTDALDAIESLANGDGRSS
ncbi:MAG: SAM-dependent methyltransferase [Deltaproteobacteria bacterium]|nr:SAM-dependent methyltransferase [Deltaproteobacteria bacterium]